MINHRCRHYRASRPCVFNKADGSECPACHHVSEYQERILFIKLDAIGDVLRSASLLPAIKARHHAPFIAWLTRSESAELVRMMEDVDAVIELSEGAVARIMSGGWDQVYSLSNDLESASLATLAAHKTTPVGFSMTDGAIRPSNEAAAHWLEMAAFDRVKRGNTQSYQELMLAIIGAPEEPIKPPALRIDAAAQTAAAERIAELFDGSRRRRVAINLGSSRRWPKKMLGAEQIHRYARLLAERAEVDILLVGGRAEADKAAEILALCGPDDRVRAALTEDSLTQFVAILANVDALLCGDTLALHIATALGLPTVAVFGPTSPAEIFDFNGLITKVWTSRLDCLICYGDCQKRDNCMSLIDLTELVELTVQQLSQHHHQQ
jgi:heptosyltransferase-1